MDDSFRASIVITTKNRKDELRTALRSCVAQTVKCEIIVLDDGSTDGTGEMVAAEFPEIRFVRSEQSVGYIVLRNRGARIAVCSILFSLDDDAVFSTPNVVEQTLADFQHPRIGAVSIPFFDQNPPFGSVKPAPPGVWVVESYVGLAHALRREIFLRLGGYRESLFHQTEESDFCVRLLAAGYVVALGHADPVHHFASPRRDNSRMVIYSARNNILRGWYYTPGRYLPKHLGGAVYNALRAAISSRRWAWTIKGLFAGLAGIAIERQQRRPIPIRVYQLGRRIIKKGRLSFAEVEPQLPLCD